MYADFTLSIKDASGRHINLLNDQHPNNGQDYGFASAPASPESNGKRRKYHCTEPGCNKSFTTSGHLARHNRIHTGEKNFPCLYPGCPSRFSRQDNMMQHYRTHLSPKSRKQPHASSRKTGLGRPPLMNGRARAMTCDGIPQRPMVEIPSFSASPPPSRHLRHPVRAHRAMTFPGPFESYSPRSVTSGGVIPSLDLRASIPLQDNGYVLPRPRQLEPIMNSRSTRTDSSVSSADSMSCSPSPPSLSPLPYFADKAPSLPPPRTLLQLAQQDSSNGLDHLAHVVSTFG